MMVSQEFRDLLYDAVTFFETIGALNELAERDLIDLEYIMTDEHKEYIQRLCNEYKIDAELDDNTESVLEAEDMIYGFFIQQLKLSYENGFKAGLDESKKRYIF